MPTSFPGAVDLASLFASDVTDDTDSKAGTPRTGTVGFLAQWMRDVGGAMVAVETELGPDPSGLYAPTVRERFEGLAFKGQSVKAASTGNVGGTYANGTAGVGATKAVGGTTLTMDGITIANGDRVLLKDQTSAFENGLYVASGVGTAVVLTRSTDGDTSVKIADVRVLVDQGTINADTEWGMVATAPTMGTTALPWRRTTPIYGHGNPRFPWDVAAPTAQVVMPTVPRILVQSLFSLAVAATQYMIGGIVVPAGRTITNVNYVATTAGATPTVDWFALARQSDRVALAHTANSVAAPALNVPVVRALTAPWTPTADTPIWVVWSLNIATTARVVAAGPTGQAALNLLAPAMAATNGVAPTVTLPTDGTTVITAATTGIVNVPLIWLT